MTALVRVASAPAKAQQAQQQPLRPLRSIVVRPQRQGSPKDLRKLFTAPQCVLRIKQKLRDSLQDGQPDVTSSWPMIESGGLFLIAPSQKPPEELTLGL